MQICVLCQIASSQVFTCEINRNEYEEKRFGGKEAVGDTHEMMRKTRRRRESGEGRRRAENGGRPGESKENWHRVQRRREGLPRGE